MLPLSHDEVVHGKGSLLRKMPGDDWQKFANLRLLYGFMYGHPGKKLLFMGAEFGQWDEWDADKSLDWHLLEFPQHQGVQLWVRDLNHLLVNEPALHQIDFEHEGFRWVDCLDSAASVVSFLRFAEDNASAVLCVCNFTPVVRENYRVGVPHDGYWEELLNSDAEVYGGSGLGNLGGVLAESHGMHDMPFSISLRLPPLSVSFFRV
jgi:1,4-alpha-glucan branching enzyme